MLILIFYSILFYSVNSYNFKLGDSLIDISLFKYDKNYENLKKIVHDNNNNDIYSFNETDYQLLSSIYCNINRLKLLNAITENKNDVKNLIMATDYLELHKIKKTDLFKGISDLKDF